ncbi:MAG: hypothetical protein GXO64_02660 [Candidatus Micrarchaeota archaeon]|nr:hypothetical protein [Candidatus Micrarchaeota archaeon]
MKENIRNYDLLLANKLERIKKANISDANKELINCGSSIRAFSYSFLTLSLMNPTKFSII